MKKTFAAGIACLAILCPFRAVAQPATSVQVLGYSYANITGDATTVVKSGPGTLHTVCLNGVTAAEVITIYDNTAASGTKIGTITAPSGQTLSCQTYDVLFSTGLTLATATQTGDITVSYR